MYRKKIFVVGLLLVSAYLLHGYYLDLVHYYTVLNAVPKAPGLEVGPVKVTLDNATDWTTVFKMMFTVLGTYAGVKVINKYIK